MCCWEVKKTAPEAQLKVIDFGMAQDWTEWRSKPGSAHKVPAAGTPHYVAPEVLDNQGYFTSDVWSLGVIFYMLLSGCPPFYGEDDAVLKRVKKGVFNFDPAGFAKVSQPTKDLIEKMLNKEPLVRLTAQQVLNDPVFAKNLYIVVSDV